MLRDSFSGPTTRPSWFMGHGIEGKTRRSPVDVETAAAVSETMQALAAPSRVRILGCLREGPCSVGDLAKAVEMTQSSVSHQLRLLRNLGLVTTQRSGRSVIYTLSDDHLASVLDEAVGHIEHLRLGIRDTAGRAPR